MLEVDDHFNSAKGINSLCTGKGNTKQSLYFYQENHIFSGFLAKRKHKIDYIVLDVGPLRLDDMTKEELSSNGVYDVSKLKSLGCLFPEVVIQENTKLQRQDYTRNMKRKIHEPRKIKHKLEIKQLQMDI